MLLVLVLVLVVVAVVAVVVIIVVVVVGVLSSSSPSPSILFVMDRCPSARSPPPLLTAGRPGLRLDESCGASPGTPNQHISLGSCMIWYANFEFWGTQAEEGVMDGVEAVLSGDMRVAVDNFLASLKQNPKDAVCAYNLACECPCTFSLFLSLSVPFRCMSLVSVACPLASLPFASLRGACLSLRLHVADHRLSSRAQNGWLCFAGCFGIMKEPKTAVSWFGKSIEWGIAGHSALDNPAGDADFSSMVDFKPFQRLCRQLDRLRGKDIPDSGEAEPEPEPEPAVAVAEAEAEPDAESGVAAELTAVMAGMTV